MFVGLRSLADRLVRAVDRLLEKGIPLVTATAVAIAPVAPAFASDPGIVLDGRTRTDVQVDGATTDIHSRTIHGDAAFNSFTRFDVIDGRTVNVHIPDGARASVNLVHGSRSQIDGTLNSVRGGEIGGDLYLLNSHGIVVGPGGRVNAGALHMQTPTQDFLDGVLDRAGRVDEERLDRIRNRPETIPLAPNGVIRVEGDINAVRSVDLHGGRVDVSGRIRVGEAGRDAIRAAVNLRGVEPLGASRGRVQIRSRETTRISGQISADGRAGVRGGSVSVRSGGDVTLAEGARVSARGAGAASSGGTVLIRAAQTARFDEGAIIDVRAGQSGDGGFVDFTADRVVSLGGGRFLAGAQNGAAGLVVIDPEDIVVTTRTEAVGADLVQLATRSIRIAAELVATGEILVAAPRIAVEAGGSIAAGGDVTLLAIAAGLDDAVYAQTSPAGFRTAVGDYARAGAQGGDIGDLDAIAAQSRGTIEREASISLADGAEIRGETITLRAAAAAQARLYDPGSDGVVDERNVANSGFANDAQAALGGLPVRMLVSIARATATVEIGDGARLVAAREIVVDADASAASRPTFDQSTLSRTVVGSLGGLYAEATAIARVSIAPTAILSVTDRTADTRVSITADTRSVVDASATFVATGESALGLGATVAIGRSEAEVAVADGARILTGERTAILVSARTRDSYSAATTVTASRAKAQDGPPGGGIAGVFTWGGFSSEAEVAFGAEGEGPDARVRGSSIEIAARSEVERSAVKAEGAVSDAPEPDPNAPRQEFGSELLSSLSDTIATAFNDAVAPVANAVLQGSSVSGAIAIQNLAQSATTTIARGLRAEGDITLAADATIGRVENRAIVEGSIQDVTFGFALALPINLVRSTADVAIGTGGGDLAIDAGGAIAVASRVSLPGPTGVYDLFTNPFGYRARDPNATAPAIENLTFLDPVFDSAIYQFIRDNGSLEGALTTLRGDLFNSISGAQTSAQAASDEQKAKTLSIVVNNNIAVFETTALARIGAGVRFNDSGAPASTAQTVRVSADVDVEHLTWTGDARIGTSGGNAGSTALGVAFSLLDLTSRARVEIGGGARILAQGDVTIGASTRERVASIGYSANLEGGDVGINGTIAINRVDALASVESRPGARIVSRAGAVSIAAQDDVGVVNLVGGITQGENVGVGVGVATNDVRSRAQVSLVGVDRLGAAGTLAVRADNGGFVVAAGLSGSLRVPEAATWAGNIRDKLREADATYGKIHENLFQTSDQLFSGFSDPVADGGSGVAAANEAGGGSDTSARAGTGTAPRPGGRAAAGSGSAGASDNPLAAAISNATGTFGINISGDASVNMLASAALVEVSGGTGSQIDADVVAIGATSRLQAVALAGAITIRKDGASGKSAAAGLAGSYVHNGFSENRVVARLSDFASVTASRLAVEANNRQQIFAIAVSGSGNSGGGRETANIAGSVGFNTLRGGETVAEIARSRIAAGIDSVRVRAVDDAMIVAISGGAAVSTADTSVGIGASAAVALMETDTLARLDDVSIDGADTVAVEADVARLVASLALGVAVQTRDSALTGAVSLTYNSIGGSVAAEVVDGALDARVLTVVASDRSIVGTGAGDAAVSLAATNTVTAGIATAVNNMTNSVEARLLGTAATIGERAEVSASLDRLAVAVAAGVSVTKGSVALKGSIALNLVDATASPVAGVSAAIGGGARIVGAPSAAIAVAASDVSRIHGYAGAVAAGKSAAGIGAAIVLGIVENDVSAEIDDAEIVTADVVTVAASTDLALFSVAASLGASRDIAVSGAIVVNVLSGRTLAAVGADARLGEPLPAPGTDVDAVAPGVGTLSVSATSASLVASAAGAGAIGGTGAGVGGALAVDVFERTTRASMHGRANLAGDLLVDARARDRTYGGVLGIGIGTSGIGIAGSVGVLVASATTEAIVGRATGSGRSILARGSIRVDAHATTDAIRAGLTGAGGTSAGVGALISVSHLTATTRALVEDGTELAALGRGLGVATRAAALSYDGLDLSASAPGTSDTSDATAAGARIEAQLSGIAASLESADFDTVDPEGVAFAASRGSETARGLVVSADSDVRSLALGLAVAGGGKVAIGAGATATVVETQTLARIGDGARVNEGFVTDDAQSVAVRAGANTLAVGAAAGAAGAGKVAVGGGVDVAIAARTVTAEIGADARVAAGGAVRVESASRDTSVSVAVGLAGAGLAGIGGGVAVGVAESETIARVGARADIEADRLLVRALSETTRFQISGAGGFGGAAGVGAAVAVLVDAGTTRALVGDGARVRARSLVEVDARSAADYRAFTVGAAGAGVAGVGAAVSVKVLRSLTEAAIGDDADVVVAGAVGGRSVSVVARSAFDLLSVTGGGGIGGKVGVGAGVDVVVGRATTEARIGARATVSGAGDVVVLADADKRADSTALALGGGLFVGVAGAVNVLTFGRALDSQQREQLSGGGPDRLASTDSFLNDDVLRRGLFDDSLDATAEGRGAGAAAQARLRGADTRAELSGSAPDFGQTRALVGAGALISAGGDVSIVAQDTTTIAVRSGGLAAGIVGIGFGAAVSKIANNTFATISDDARIRTDGTLRLAARDGGIALSPSWLPARSGSGSNSVLAFTGAAGGIAANVAVAVALTEGVTQARIGAGVTIARRTPVLDAYSPDYRFAFTAEQRALLRREGWSEAQIAAEERRRTLLYHAVHEQLVLAGAGLSAPPRPAGVSEADFALYSILRGDLAYDPDAAFTLTPEALSAIEGQIRIEAETRAERDVAQREAALTASIVALNTPENRGAAVSGESFRDVTGIYDPSRTDRAYVEFWRARNVRQTGGTPPTFVADDFPAGYVFVFPGAERDREISEQRAAIASALGATLQRLRDDLTPLYQSVHRAVLAELPGIGIDRFGVGAPDEETALYWLARRADLSAGRVVVEASEETRLLAEAYGGAIGAAAVGAQVAIATKAGLVEALVADATPASGGARIDARTLAINATQAGRADAKAIGGNAGTIAAVGGVVADATNRTTTRAAIGAGARLALAEGLDMSARAQPQVAAEATGVNVAGGAAVGVSSATTRLENVVRTTIGAGATIVSGGDVRVSALGTTPSGAPSASVDATAGSGALLIGAAGAVALNRVRSDVALVLGEGVTLAVAPRDGLGTRNASFLARSDTSARIDATGIGVGFVGLGLVVAQNDLSNSARTIVGAGLTGRVEGRLDIASEGTESALARAVSGAGGVVAGAAAEVSSAIASTVRTSVADGSHGAGIAARELVFRADRLEGLASARSDSGRASLVGYSGSWVDTVFTTNVGVRLGTGLLALADERLSVTATNRIAKTLDEFTVRAGSGGVIDISSARSRVFLLNHVDVDIMGARLFGRGHADIDISARNTVVVADFVSLDAGGAIASTTSESRLVSLGAGDRSQVTIGAGARVETALGSIGILAATHGDIEMRASSKTYGLAGGADARANVAYQAGNRVIVQGGAAVEAGLDVFVYTGDPARALAARTFAFAHNKTAIPIATSPNIDNSVVVRNLVDVTGARVVGARDVTIDTRGGTVSARGYGEAEDWAEAVKAFFENVGRLFTGDEPKPLKRIVTGGSALQLSQVQVGTAGLVQAGARSARSLRLVAVRDLDGPDPDRIVRYEGATIDPRDGAIGFTQERDVNVTARLRAERIALELRLASAATPEERDILRGEIETVQFLIDQLGPVDVVRDVITLDPVFAQTGDVAIFAQTLGGGGVIRTSQRLEVRVENPTGSDLVVSDIILDPRRRGEVRYNGRSITSFPTVTIDIDAPSGGGPLISVRNTLEDVRNPGTPGDVSIRGDLVNRFGTIRVGSTGGIVISGAIEGNTVELLAAGSLVQRFRNGFTHTGGLPYVAGSRGSFIAGGNVFLAGQFLNLNGIVQAGIPIRDLVLGADIADTVELLDRVWAAYQAYLADDMRDDAPLRAVAHGAPGRAGEIARQATEDLLAAGRAARIVVLTSFLDAGQPIVSGYDLETRRLEVQRTAVGGGLATLYGHILATASGEIRVTDGYGELTVDSAVDRPLVLYGLDTGQGIAGRVRIVDTAYADGAAGILGRETLYSRDEDGRMVVDAFTRREVVDADGRFAVVLDPLSHEVSAGSSRLSEYRPRAGQNYYVTVDSEALRPSCEQLSPCTGLQPTSLFADLFTRLGLPVPTSTFTTTQLSASQPVAVRFIGAEEGTIDVSALSDVILAGDIVNTTGETRIVSTNGSILRADTAIVRAANLTLRAGGRIGAVDPNDATGLWIALEGPDGLLREAIAGNGIVLSERRGTLLFDRIDAGGGDAIVRAADSIVGRAGNLVSGRGITLDAIGGSIGSAATRVRVDTGASEGLFSAFAADDAHLVEIAGDLRVDRIRAGGLVDLVVDRNLLDRNTRAEESGLDDATRRAFWRDAGLIDEPGDAAAQASLQRTIEGFVAKREREHDEYWSDRNLRFVRDADTGAVIETVADPYDPAFVFRFAPDVRNGMIAQGVSEAAIAQLEASRTASYHAVHARIGAPAGAEGFDPAYAFVPSQAEIDALSSGYLWTTQELFGSINRALFSDRTDTDPFVEDPNVVANRLRLSVGGDIGEVRGVFNLTLPPPGEAIDPALQAQLYTALAQAERDDITYVYRRNGVLFEAVGEQIPGAELVAIRIELKEDFDVDVSGDLVANAGGEIFLGAEELDLSVTRIASTSGGAVRLRSRLGILNARADDDWAVGGGDVVLEASTRSIGAPDKPLVLDVLGKLTARAGQSIFIEQARGDLAIDFATARDTFSLVARSGGIIDARGDRNTNIRAQTIRLVGDFVGTRGPGALGLAQRPVAPGRIDVTARSGAVHLEGTEGDLFLGRVSAPSGDVVIDAFVGGLFSAAPGVNVEAPAPGTLATLLARGGIGTRERPLGLSVHRLVVENRDRDGSGTVAARPAVGDIWLTEADDLLLAFARNAARGGVLSIEAADDLTVEPDALVLAADGAIRLVAAADGFGGDLVQRVGRGRIDAGAGSVFGRAEEILLENPVIADRMRFELVRPGRSMILRTLLAGSEVQMRGGYVTVDTLAHTGGPGLLRVGIADVDRPTKRLRIASLTSPFGAFFDPFSVVDGEILSGVSRAVFPAAYVGRWLRLVTNETEIIADQLSPKILRTGIQIHQKPITPFAFDIDRFEFVTDALLIKFDRRLLTAIILTEQDTSQFRFTVFDATGLLMAADMRVGALYLASEGLQRIGDPVLRAPIREAGDEDEESDTAPEEGGLAGLACTSRGSVPVALGGACGG